MYDIEINFLKDRGLNAKTTLTGKKKRKAQPIETKIPLIIGGAALLLLPLATFGYLSVLNSEKEQTQKEIASMEDQIKQLSAQQADVKKLQQQLEEARAQRQALVTVFDQIKPSSVILQEISELAPTGIQIQSIVQDPVQPPPAAPSGAAATPAPPAPIPPITYTIKGFGRSHNDVNDFLLTLKSSDFLNPDKTILNSSVLTNSSLTPEAQDQLKKQNKAVDLPQVSSFEITTQLSDKPASQLLEQLTSRGALGLVTRIKQLQDIGAIEKK